MLNNREYNFLVDLFKQNDSHLFEHISYVYENNFSLFLEHLIAHNFNLNQDFKWLIDDFEIEKSSELLFSKIEELEEFIDYINRLGIKSELNEIIKKFINTNDTFSEEEISLGIKNKERISLKDLFNNLDNEIFLSENEIKYGIKLIERRKIKKKFIELDKKHPLKKINTTKEFTLKFSKYAAILIIIISLSYFSKSLFDFSSNTELITKNIDNTSVKTDFIPIPSTESFVGLNNNYSTDKIFENFNVELKEYDVNEAIELKKTLTNKKEKTTHELKTLLELKNNLIQYSENYKANNNKITLLLNNTKQIKLDDINIVSLYNENVYLYFLKINNQFYPLNFNSKLNYFDNINDPKIESILSIIK
jgi:hypothetical protein